MAFLDIEFNDIFIAENRKCKFKNCKITFVDGKSNRVYCSKPCKNKDQVYKIRERKKKKPTGRPVGWRGKYKEQPLPDFIEIKKDLSIETTNFILNI